MVKSYMDSMRDQDLTNTIYCEICDDVMWTRDTLENLVPCKCQNDRETSDIKPEHTLDHFIPQNDNQRIAKDLSNQFVNDEIKNLAVVGNFVTGKTTLSRAIYNTSIMKTGKNGIDFENTADFKRILDWDRDSARRLDDVNVDLDYLKNIPVLIFEIFYRHSYTPNFKDQLAEVMCYRVDQPGTKTVLTVAPKVTQLRNISNQLYERVIKDFSLVKMDN